MHAYEICMCKGNGAALMEKSVIDEIEMVAVRNRQGDDQPVVSAACFEDYGDAPMEKVVVDEFGAPELRWVCLAEGASRSCRSRAVWTTRSSAPISRR